MIKKYNEYIKEGLNQYLKGPTKEEIIKNISSFSFEQIIELLDVYEHRIENIKSYLDAGLDLNTEYYYRLKKITVGHWLYEQAFLARNENLILLLMDYKKIPDNLLENLSKHKMFSVLYKIIDDEKYKDDLKTLLFYSIKSLNNDYIIILNDKTDLKITQFHLDLISGIAEKYKNVDFYLNEIKETEKLLIKLYKENI